MMRHWILSALAVAGVLVSCAAVEARGLRHSHGGGGGSGCSSGGCASSDGCGSAAPSCGYVTETRTVMVPEMATEYRTVTSTEYRQQVQSRSVTRYRSVPVTSEV